MASSGTIRDARRGEALRISVDELADQIATLEAELNGGRAVELVRSGVVIAEVRAPQATVEADEKPLPEFKARLRSIWGDKPLDVDMTAMIRDDRDARG